MNYRELTMGQHPKLNHLLGQLREGEILVVTWRTLPEGRPVLGIVDGEPAFQSVMRREFGGLVDHIRFFAGVHGCTSYYDYNPSERCRGAQDDTEIGLIRVPSQRQEALT